MACVAHMHTRQVSCQLATFDLQVTLLHVLLTKVLVNCFFHSGEEAQNIYSRWPPWRPFRISDLLLSVSQPYASYQIPSHLAFWFRRRSSNYIFKMATRAL